MKCGTIIWQMRIMMFLSWVCSVVEYDLIIIPILKDKHKETNAKRWPTHSDLSIKKYDKLDIGVYDEATEGFDIDSFDETKDRYDETKDRYDETTDRYDETKDRYDETKDKYGVNLSNGNGPERLGEDFSLDHYEDDKIVGGYEVDINLYPYHVGYGSNCGGAIIGNKWVITAGHCGKKPYIKTGSKYLNQGKKITVKNNFVHPMWSAKNKEHPFDFDFQLLELSESLKYDANIQPIKIARLEHMVIGKVVTVTGWGNTEENGPYSNVLRAVRVPIISKENCQQVPFPYFRGALTPRMFCAGFNEGKKDACQGDSGGPAVSYDRLLGMVSFGYGCATPGSFGVYSKVAKVRSWISETTGLTLD